jgi:hypothetical protein
MKKMKKKYSLFPQAEVPKAVGKIGLVAGAFETKCGAEVDQCRFIHLVTVFAKKYQHPALVMSILPK